MVDNLKSAVLQRLAGVAPVFNPRYLDFAHHYGFAIEPCNVARGNEKGRVESGVGYVKKHFLRGLELTDLSAIQAAAQVWLDTIANVRIHGETHQRPRRHAATRASAAEAAKSTSLRRRAHCDHDRLKPVPHHARHQHLFRSLTIRSPPLDA